MIVRPLERGVEASREGVLLDLPIPLVGHEFLEPLGKFGKFTSREA